MLNIDKDNNITLTRGDTGIFNITLTEENGEEYTPQDGSSMRFALARRYGSTRGECLIVKDIPTDTMVLELEPSDTDELPFGDYLYDIEFTDQFGRVSTVIMAKFKVAKEVY